MTTDNLPPLPEPAAAYLVQYVADGPNEWVEAHASYGPASESAARHKGRIDDLFTAEQMHEYVRAALAAAPHTAAPVVQPVVPAGFALVAVRGLYDLMETLERADRKGYMPHFLIEAWEGFSIAPLGAAPASDADSMQGSQPTKES